MTTIQAQDCAKAATDSGYAAALTPDPTDGTVWQVRVTAPDFLIPASLAASLATTQGVTAMVADVKLS
jgi:hypothetical protein